MPAPGGSICQARLQTIEATKQCEGITRGILSNGMPQTPADRASVFSLIISIRIFLFTAVRRWKEKRESGAAVQEENDSVTSNLAQARSKICWLATVRAPWSLSPLGEWVRQIAIRLSRESLRILSLSSTTAFGRLMGDPGKTQIVTRCLPAYARFRETVADASCRRAEASGGPLRREHGHESCRISASSGSLAASHPPI